MKHARTETVQGDHDHPILTPARARVVALLTILRSGLTLGLTLGVLSGVYSPPLEAQQRPKERTLTRSPNPRPSSGTPTRRAPSGTPAQRNSGDGGSSGTSKGHHAGHGYHYGHRYGYYPSYRHYGRYFYGYPPYFYYGYPPYGYGGYAGYSGYGYPSYDMGALDLDVRPKKAEVYIDGNYIGVVDKYDGFPRYLWLGKGSYEISFYKDGYETLTRAVTIYPGVVIDIKDELSPGAGVRPEPRADSGDRYEEPDRPERGEPEYGERQQQRRRDRGNRRYNDGGGGPNPPHAVRPSRPDRPPLVDGPSRSSDEPSDLRSEPALLRLSVYPSDASVYLDGRFLGSAEELSRLHSALIMDPGDHILQAVRPGYRTRELKFTAAEGQEVTLDIELKE